ncbi:MAG: hypothetical protein WC852_01195 [Candidatus Nanoarchaeia archaeon]|jgi:hypothetical protein
MRLFILLLVLAAMLLIGCSVQTLEEQDKQIKEQDKQSTACPNTCDETALRGRIDSAFGFDSYTIQCSECDLSRGGFIKARIVFEGSAAMNLYYHNGWCSSGGADCGWEVSVTSYTRDKFEDVKEKFCGQLQSEGYTGEIPAGGVCGTQQYDTTEDVRQKCMKGEYDTIDSQRASFSVVQEGNRCGYSVSKGVLHTF